MLAPQSTEPLVALTIGVPSRTREQIEALRRELPAALASAIGAGLAAASHFAPERLR